MTNICKCYLCALGEIQENDFVLESLAKAAEAKEKRVRHKKVVAKDNSVTDVKEEVVTDKVETTEE